MKKIKDWFKEHKGIMVKGIRVLLAAIASAIVTFITVNLFRSPEYYEEEDIIDAEVKEEPVKEKASEKKDSDKK